MFPQEFIVKFKNTVVTIERISIMCSGVKKLIILSSVKTQPINFEKIVDVGKKIYLIYSLRIGR